MRLVTALRLDDLSLSDYAGPMKRSLSAILLLLFAAPLSACGITGSLKTPPPLFGEVNTTDAETEEAVDTSEAIEPIDAIDEDDRPRYGVDVADTP